MEENRETGRTDRERIRELEQELEQQKAKYRIISGMVQCGLWEYGIATGELVQSRRVEGMAPGDRLRIPDFRRTMSESGLIAKEDAEIFSALCDSAQAIGSFIFMPLENCPIFFFCGSWNRSRFC